MAKLLKFSGLALIIFSLAACNATQEISESTAKMYLKNIIEKLRKDVPSTITIKLERNEYSSFDAKFPNEDNVKSMHYYYFEQQTFDLEDSYYSTIGLSYLKVTHNGSDEEELLESLEQRTWRYFDDDGLYHQASLVKNYPEKSSWDNKKTYTTQSGKDKSYFLGSFKMILQASLFINYQNNSETFGDDLRNIAFSMETPCNNPKDVPSLESRTLYYSNGSEKDLSVHTYDNRDLNRNDCSDSSLNGQDLKILDKITYVSNQKFKVTDYFYVDATTRSTLTYTDANGDIYRTNSWYETRESYSQIEKDYPDLKDFVNETRGRYN